ncbi:MAG: hypothetical protein ACRYG8_42800 [Janthinobacterium lividum]
MSMNLTILHPHAATTAQSGMDDPCLSAITRTLDQAMEARFKP